MFPSPKFQVYEAIVPLLGVELEALNVTVFVDIGIGGDHVKLAVGTRAKLAVTLPSPLAVAVLDKDDALKVDTRSFVFQPWKTKLRLGYAVKDIWVPRVTLRLIVCPDGTDPEPLWHE